MDSHYWNARAATKIYEELQRRADANTAPQRPPQQWAAFEDLAIYCCGHGKDLIMVPANDPRIAGNQQVRRQRAFYKE